MFAKLKAEDIKPYRCWLFGEPILGRYESPAGILVVKDMKRNPKVEKFRVISIGGMMKKLKGKKQVYAAKVGQTAWMKRATAKKISLEDKLYCFVHNDDIVAAR